MNDPLSIPRIKLCHPAVVQKFIDFTNACETGLGITLRAVQTLRTFAEQQAIWDQGRTTPGPIVTKAKPGYSYHQYGMAVDYGHLVVNGTVIDWHFDYSLLLPYMPEGMTWGGNFTSIKDYPHFEITMGYTVEQLLAKHNASDFISGTPYVNL